MKGVLKGFKYISQIFDEDQEDEMQIGLPTDVKHVAHIGMDGPSSESPSWLKDYKASERPQSAPLDSKGDLLESSDIKTSKDTSDIPKPSRRHHSADNLTIEPPDRKITSKSKGSRRHHRKDSSEGSVSKSGRRRHHRKDSSSSDHDGSSRSGRITQEMMSDGDISEAPSPSSPTPRRLPAIPKSSRRKKSKEDSTKSSSSSKSKASSNVDVTPSSATTTIVTCNNESCQISSRSSPPFGADETGEMVVGCQNSA